MKCSNCGKEIPFAGEVCPFCHASKKGDQAQHVALVIGLVVGALVGFGGLTALGVESLGAKIGVTFGMMIAFGVLGARAKGRIDADRK